MKRIGFGVAVLAAVIVVSGCSDGVKELKFGESTDVSALKGGTIGVSVTRIDAGSNADLASLENASKYAGQTPYYVHYAVVKKTGDLREDGDYAAYDGDKQLTHLSVQSALDFSSPLDPKLHKFDKCTDQGSWAQTAPGQTLEDCMIFLADPGTGRPTKIELVSSGDHKAKVRWS
ncbi:hypothetical protein [Nocardia sp. NPDC006630]|uniref:hypothetical protein n=1 Tax=Nocardia sp. NPDC006630 TaxID=3157181 RepID=UPI0033BBA963